MDAPSLTSTPALRRLLPLVMFLRIWEQDTWNSRTSDKILLMISCSVPPPPASSGRFLCHEVPLSANIARLMPPWRQFFRSVFSVRLAPSFSVLPDLPLRVRSRQGPWSDRRRRERCRRPCRRSRGGGGGGGGGGQRVGGHHAGDQALVVEFLCRYVPLSATIGPPGAGLRAVFRTRSSLIRFEGFTPDVSTCNVIAVVGAGYALSALPHLSGRGFVAREGGAFRASPADRA